MVISPHGGELKVSVIVPAYNATRTLEATVASALAQTVRDIEVIVVDDGSTDATPALLSKLSMSEPRLCLVTQPNAGVSAARNAGIAKARAAVIAFLDADDLWPQHHLSAHLDILAREPEVDVSFSSARFIDDRGQTVGAARPTMGPLDAACLLRSNPTSTTSTWVVRRRAFERVGEFDVPLKRSEDQAWLVRAALAGLVIKGSTNTIVDYRMSTTGLASDLAGMRTGFVAMLDRVAQDHPAFVAAHKSAALAGEDLYLARRALQLALPVGVARTYLARAFHEAPTHFLRRPRETLGVLWRALLSIRNEQQVSP